MLRLLRGKSEETTTTYRGELDIKRYTRIEPRETRTLNTKMYTRFPKAPPQDPAPEVVAKPRRVHAKPQSTITRKPSPQPSQTAIEFSDPMHTEDAISVAFLRRALPMRFREVDAKPRRKQMHFTQSLDCAFS